LFASAAACTSGVTPRPTPTPSTPVVTERPSLTALPSESQPSARPTSTRPAPARHVARTNYEASVLPLHLTTASASQVITVVADASGSTEAQLQAWQRSSSGWTRVGSPVQAWLGSAGMSTQASETSTATPIGSFTLTQAFGHDPNPGTKLPYRQTTPADWWISQAGPLYNTEQHCAGTCPFTQGSPNEHLYYEMPYYTYAVVIDYNTHNSATGVVPGAGSAFFLHVTVGQPTQGCVSIAESSLISILRWLQPADHPRILIGVA
jgi:L,D-peptidoglycan transpeptidase YkuD (ErfK/YbiS/YcfS/YnhG family)